VEDASGRRLYVCLRCGNKFWSRAKKPQCSVCRSKRVIPYEEFLQLPQEEQERILGRQEEKKAERVEVTKVKEGEAEGNSVKIEESPEGERGKSGDSPGETGGNSGKKSESLKVPRAHQGEKQGEKVKGERVKKGFRVPVPRLSAKVIGIIVGAAFIYYLYKVGWFDSILEHLKFMKSSSEAVKGYEEERKRSPVLGKIESNLRG